jgi:hypothetical protein
MNPLLLEGNWPMFRKEILEAYGSLGILSGKGRGEPAKRPLRRAKRSRSRMFRMIREFCC